MTSSTKKGKIPRNEWPKIFARYASGDTIAQIGRDYGCTAPAVRYIIKRTGGLKGPPATNSDGIETGTVATKAPVGPASPPPRAALRAEVHDRITGDIAAFLVALDQAALSGSPESAAALHEATDRLMRSTARVRLELERLQTEHETRAASAAPPSTSAARAGARRVSH